MPELPEVETVKRTLEHLVVGKTIESVKIYWPNIIKEPDDINHFQMLLIGQKIIGMGRRGKFLIFYLDDYVLVSHLRMEGRYRLEEKNIQRNKHVHVVFNFTDGTELHYQDVRKFGTMHLFPKGKEESTLPLSQLGLEPFSDEFTTEYLYRGLKKTTRTLKTALLDQKLVVGLGNIYVDEALFRAGLHPQKLANRITKKNVFTLHKAIVETLSEAVAQGGSTVRSYVNSQGDMGMFQQFLYVYARKGEACRNCETPIQKMVLGGRGTHFCPNCQK